LRIISIANQKGGVAKTTTSINLGTCLSNFGKKVLLIDMDPQAHTTIGLGVEPNELEKTMLNVLEPNRSPSKLDLDEVMMQMEEMGDGNLYVAPSNIDFASAEYKLIDQIGREDFLNIGIQNCKIDFDYIIIDCPPSLGILTINALKASTEVIIPIQPHYFALRGIEEFMETIKIVHQNLHHPLEIYVLVTIADTRSNISKEVIEETRDFFKERVFKTIIRKNIALVESTSQGIPIIYYNAKSHGAEDYSELAQEVISFEKEKISTRLY
jgi:chromosome partitioning protein